MPPIFHRQLRLHDVHPLVGQDAGDIIKGSKANIAPTSDQDRVVLSVGVGSRDEPAVGNCIYKGLIVFMGTTRMAAQQVDNFAYPKGPRSFSYFHGWGEAMRLTHVFLMHADYSACHRRAVVTLYDNCSLIPKSSNRGVCDRKAQRARKLQAKMFVFPMPIPFPGRCLEASIPPRSAIS